MVFSDFVGPPDTVFDLNKFIDEGNFLGQVRHAAMMAELPSSKLYNTFKKF
jgi:hypothetical protein